jgi:hypothetical protein
MRTFLYVILCLSAFNATAQLTKPVHKVVLFSGEVFTGERLVYETPILRPAYFALDMEEFESSSVNYFQNNHGYFTNLARLHGMNSERYALRIATGKMNLFEEVDLSVYGGDELKTADSSGIQDPMLATGEMYEYYSKGDQPVRKASYRNLVVDLKDNEQSIKHLHAYRNYTILQWGMLGVGSAIIAANIMAQSNSAVRFNPVMALGIVIGGGSYLMERPKHDELWLAADEYNKEEEVLSER